MRGVIISMPNINKIHLKINKLLLNMSVRLYLLNVMHNKQDHYYILPNVKRYAGTNYVFINQIANNINER